VTQKIALITGGSRGLGHNTALHLAAKGVDIIITYRTNKVAADNVVGEIIAMGRKAVALPFDAGDRAALPTFVASFKSTLTDNWQQTGFDYLVNNAGAGVYASFADTSESEFDEMLTTHFKSVFFLTQALAPIVKDGGHIVNISSGLTRFSVTGYIAYASAKAAVEVMTRYMAKELGPRRINVNVIAPGAIETDFGGGGIRDNPELNKTFASLTAMGRVGLPDDVGGAIASLLTGDNGWVTAQRIEVSGGANL
jgi:NAD(P)-dependent dehydrogenase (short-subunit alcohol dehydrogenase family)